MKFIMLSREMFNLTNIIKVKDNIHAVYTRHLVLENISASHTQLGKNYIIIIS